MNHGSKDTRCYLDSALEVYMCYDRLLFSIYKEKNLPPIYTTDHAKLIVWEKGAVTLDVFIDSKLEVVYFYNIFYIPELEYNFFSVGIIEKASYSILAKK